MPVERFFGTLFLFLELNQWIWICRRIWSVFQAFPQSYLINVFGRKKCGLPLECTLMLNFDLTSFFCSVYVKYQGHTHSYSHYLPIYLSHFIFNSTISCAMCVFFHYFCPFVRMDIQLHILDKVYFSHSLSIHLFYFSMLLCVQNRLSVKKNAANTLRAYAYLIHDSFQYLSIETWRMMRYTLYIFDVE